MVEGYVLCMYTTWSSKNNDNNKNNNNNAWKFPSISGYILDGSCQRSSASLGSPFEPPGRVGWVPQECLSGTLSTTWEGPPPKENKSEKTSGNLRKLKILCDISIFSWKDLKNKLKLCFTLLYLFYWSFVWRKCWLLIFYQGLHFMNFQ